MNKQLIAKRTLTVETGGKNQISGQLDPCRLLPIRANYLRQEMRLAQVRVVPRESLFGRWIPKDNVFERLLEGRDMTEACQRCFVAPNFYAGHLKPP
jgi:hypothetical protein